MHETIRNFIETMLDFVASVRQLGFPDTIEEIWQFIKDVLFKVIPSMSTMYILFFAIAAGVIAFAGYKLFKMGLYGVGAVGFVYLAKILAPIVAPYVAGIIPESVDFTALLMCVFGVIAVILTRISRKFMVLCVGGFVGYLIGSSWIYPVIVGYFNTLDFLQTEIAMIILSSVCAAIIAIICMLLIHHAWIICSALGGMATCGLLAGIAIVPNGGKEIWLYFIGAGLIAGLIAVVYQYQQEKRANDIFYTFTL